MNRQGESHLCEAPASRVRDAPAGKVDHTVFFPQYLINPKGFKHLLGFWNRRGKIDAESRDTGDEAFSDV